MECCGAKFFHGQERMILLSRSADVNAAFQSILLFGEKGAFFKNKSFSSIACHHSISLADIGAMDSLIQSVDPQYIHSSSNLFQGRKSNFRGFLVP